MNPTPDAPYTFGNDLAYLGNGQALMWGGDSSFPFQRIDTWIYTYSTNSWSLDPNGTPSAGGSQGLAETSLDGTSEIVLFGGYNQGSSYFDETWLFGGGDFIYGTVGGNLYEDLNNSGGKDVGEPGLQNIDIDITNRHGTVQTVETDANGDYTAHLPWGNATIDVDETDPDFSSSFIQTSGVDPEAVNITVGVNHVSVDKGYFHSSVLISGYVKDGVNIGVEGVDVAFSNGGATVTTNVAGHYATSVSSGWNGTSTATKSGWTFAPTNYTYPAVTTDQTDQDYVGAPAVYSVSISGYVKDGVNIGVEGVDITFSNGGATVTTNATGYYNTSVAIGWNGTSTATKSDWTFTPVSHTYSPVTTNHTDQDYVGIYTKLGVEDYNWSLPMEFTVLPAYPNPFNPSTTIRYGLSADCHVKVEIYDISGKLISTLINTEQTQGWHSIIWNGENSNNVQVPAGIYLSKITSNNEVKTTKLMLLK